MLEIDVEAGFAEVEGMTTYAELVDATLPHGLVPAIVPELKSITVGGAVTGVASSPAGSATGWCTTRSRNSTCWSPTAGC